MGRTSNLPERDKLRRIDHISLLVSDDDLPAPRRRDTPLWIKYETKPIWSALREALGVDPTGAAIAVALYEAERMGRASVSYSRHKGYYSKARRHPLLTYRRTLKAVASLEEGNWITHLKQAPGGRGWQSPPAATPCGTALRHICWRAATTSAPSRSSSATATCRPR